MHIDCNDSFVQYVFSHRLYVQRDSRKNWFVLHFYDAHLPCVGNRLLNELNDFGILFSSPTSCRPGRVLSSFLINEQNDRLPKLLVRSLQNPSQLRLSLLYLRLGRNSFSLTNTSHGFLLRLDRQQRNDCHLRSSVFVTTDPGLLLWIGKNFPNQ